MQKPAYQVIYDSIIEQIQNGVLPVGSRIPSEKELSTKFQVSRITSKRALDTLAAKRIIERKQGKGSFVLTTEVTPQEQNRSSEYDFNSSEKKMLGLILPDLSGSFGMDMVIGFEAACFQNNCHFVFKRSYGDPDIESHAIQAMIELGVSGIGIMPLHGEFYNPSILQLILDGFPTVIIDRHYLGINSCFVGTDNVYSAKAVTHQLIANGHRNIAFLSPPIQDNSALQDRITGLTLAFQEADITPDRALWFDQISSTLPRKDKPQAIEANIKVLANHFANYPEITAVFAAEYNIALIAKSAVQSIGKRVPDDISIVCFDSPARLDNDHEFSHIKQDEIAISNYAVEKLTNFQGTSAYSLHTIKSKYVPGNSTKTILR